MAQQTPVVVITGGPNGGKTTIMEFLERHFKDNGYTVVVLPEVATQLIQDGQGPAVVGLEEFQRLVVVKSVEQEERAKARLNSIDGKKVIFVDRGIMDGAAYVERDVIQRVWDSFGYNHAMLRDERYAGVIHLESTAVGLPELYEQTCKDNPARYESVEEARETDRRTRDAWIGTPHFAYVDNSTDFDGKIERALTWATYFLEDIEHERKYRLQVPFDRSHLPDHAQCIEIKQWYVRDPAAAQARIRMRSQDGHHVYTKNVKLRVGEMSNTEVEELISEQYFLFLQAYKIPQFAEVTKDRWCFVENGFYWELDVLRDLPDRCLLEVELPDPSWKHLIQLPSRLAGRVVDTTGSDSDSNLTYAREIAKLRAA